MRPDLRECDVVPSELGELRRLVRRLPREWRDQLAPLCRDLAEWAQRHNRLIAAAQEEVGNLQLDIKFLRFDLDVTRRERDEVRRRAGNK